MMGMVRATLYPTIGKLSLDLLTSFHLELSMKFHLGKEASQGNLIPPYRYNLDNGNYNTCTFNIQLTNIKYGVLPTLLLG